MSASIRVYRDFAGLQLWCLIRGTSVYSFLKNCRRDSQLDIVRIMKGLEGAFLLANSVDVLFGYLYFFHALFERMLRRCSRRRSGRRLQAYISDHQTYSLQYCTMLGGEQSPSPGTRQSSVELLSSLQYRKMKSRFASQSVAWLLGPSVRGSDPRVDAIAAFTVFNKSSH